MRANAFVTVLLLVVCLLVGGAHAQQDFSKVEMKATKVAGNIYMLEGAGGNIGVSAGADGVLIIDDQFAPLADKIRAALKEINPGQLRFVLNTHYHGDHTGSNVVFGKEATIIAHDNVRARLAAEQTVLGQKTPAAPKEALPVITYAQSVSVHFNGEEIRVIHFPTGHTDGDSVIFFTDSKVVHMGDDFVTYGFPFVDVGSGGSVSGMIAGIEKVLGMTPPDVKVIPGHGPLCTPEDVRKFVQMLKDTRALVAQTASQGKTAEQMKQDHLLSKFEDLGKGFIKTDAWIDLLYAESTQKTNSASDYQNHGHADERK